MNPELLYQLALTAVPQIGPVQARILVDHFGEATAIFKAKRKELASIDGIGEIRAKTIKDFRDFENAEEEIRFIEKYRLRPLFLTDPDYPKRLLHCYDPPTLLYYQGNANLNNKRVASIIGTRNNSTYGREITISIVNGLQPFGVLVVSGLAFGIDAIAHRAALQAQLPTVGVLAHGLDTIYPPQHAQMATEMIANGGLLTEFPSNTKPDKHNFPRRNRVVAGMADVTIVIETAVKGGSMITAELACNYNRDLFAVPARTTDSKSLGCLALIQQNKAMVFTDIAQLVQTMGWDQKPATPKIQRELFIELSSEEESIVALLKEKEGLHIDEIYLKTNLSSSSVAAAILNLEMQNVITALPGKMYRLN